MLAPLPAQPHCSAEVHHRTCPWNPVNATVFQLTHFQLTVDAVAAVRLRMFHLCETHGHHHAPLPCPADMEHAAMLQQMSTCLLEVSMKPLQKSQPHCRRRTHWQQAMQHHAGAVLSLHVCARRQSVPMSSAPFSSFTSSGFSSPGTAAARCASAFARSSAYNSSLFALPNSLVCTRKSRQWFLNTA